MRKGLTLIELMITIVMFVILMAGVFYVFRALLLSWSSQETRTGIDINLDRGIEEMVRDLREAAVIGSVNSDEIRFTTDDDYIYYLYDENDSYPSDFDETSYQLMRTALTGGISGTFTYGSGTIIMGNVLPPPISDLSISGNMITLDLSITRKDETIRSRTEVRPRNI